MFRRNLPRDYQNHINKFFHKFLSFLYPYIEVTFHEYSDDYHSRRNTAYIAIENYLSSKSIQQVRSLKADSYRGNRKLLLSMEDNQEVTDDFQGLKLLWSKETSTSKSYFRDKKRFYKLTFNRKHREFITGDYIKHVIEEGNAIELRSRQRKLHANGSKKTHAGNETASWSHILFNHPASFETLAIDPGRKKEIMDDLVAFTKSEEYYARIGKAWKRGYLLYGPPGTGKTTMIAAVANFLNYDIYDLELTAVKDNTELRKLLIEISSKAIVVIEDIDCSLDITGQRKKSKRKEKKKKKKKKKNKNKKKKKESEDEDSDGDDDDDDDDEEDTEHESEDESSSKVTLSGLLNIIDGIWSASGGERIIIFTTNHVEKLDEALIRRGRMDKHIELSYCEFEGFKVLAKNYLSIDSHALFEVIRSLLEKTKMSPADVAESLMQKSIEEDAETCLNRLIQDLETAQEKGMMKEEEDEGDDEEQEEDG
ncbi:AAA-ATPase At3g28580 [Linum grandiflorum]